MTTMRMTARGGRGTTRRGVVLVMTLLAVVLLLALILYVLNLGDQVNRRQRAQDTADATAIAGATWVARQLNIVSENNMTIARNIALINALDSMSQSTEYTLREHTSMTEAMQRLNTGTLNNSYGVMNDHLVDVFEAWEERMLDQLEQLEDMNDLYQQISVEEMTYYNAPSGGHGAIWQAMFAMDELSQVTMENLASTTQTMAITAGEHTMRYPDSTDTMLAPVKVELPWSRGHFNDFEWPVKFGVLPGAPPSVNEDGVLVDRITTPSATMVIDDPLERRGPFDTLFGYNYVVRQCPVPTQPSPNSRVLTGGGGAIPLGSGEGVTRICPDPPGWDVVGYRTYGTHDALVSTSFVLNYNESTGWNDYGDARRIGLIDWHLYRHMPDTRLDVYVRTMADAKLDYLWPPPNEDGEVVEAGEEVTLQGVIDPEWVTDFSEAMRVTGSREGRRSVRGVAYFVYEIKSLYPPSHGSFMSPGTWAPVLDNGRRQPRISWGSRWTDPNQWDADPSVTRVHPYGWMDEYPIEVHYDADLGITRSFDDEGLPVAVTIYRVDHFYFAGINVGERELIPNCYAGFNRDTSAAPAPLHLHPDQINASAESRRDYLTFLSVTRGSDRARNWPSGFRSGKPEPYQVAVAQAKVFNTHSWDAWTPTWYATLEPVSDWGDWQQRIDRADPDAYVDGAFLDFVTDYFDRAGGLAEVMLRH